MADREKVIKGLECCYADGMVQNCEECPYAEQDGTCYRIDPLLRDALELLKAQEPRVMTLEDAINSEIVWIECSNGDGGYGTCRLVEIYGMVAAEVFMLKNKYPERNRLNPEKYLMEWRCLTSRPDEKARVETPWGS